MLKFFLIIVSFYFFQTLYANSDLALKNIAKAPTLQDELTNEMNGLKISDFKNFDVDWKYVTSRYRTDTNEFRVVYANPMAWQTLISGKVNFPDGSAFAKIGYGLATDPIFPVSLVPKTIVRYQFMIKDSIKAKDTDGWTYALFYPSGKASKVDQRGASMACAACHKIAQARGFVFSEKMPTNTFKNILERAQNSPYSLSFENVNIKELPYALRSNLPKGTQLIRGLLGEIRSYVFEGTLNEIQPILWEESLRTGAPAALISRDQKAFVAIMILKGEKCGNDGTKVKIISTPIWSLPGQGQLLKKFSVTEKERRYPSVIAQEFCHNK